MNFKNSYSREEFLEFVNDLIPGITKDIRPVNLGNNYRAIKHANFLGTSDELDLSIFELKIEGKAEKKIYQAKEGFKLMKEYQTYRALAIYYSEDDQNWRLSLMQMTPEKTETGNITQKFSNPRRYSFYLGPQAKTKTPENFLIRKGTVKDFDDLLSRFSVEVVNKEFYREIAKYFRRLVGGDIKIGSKSEHFEPEMTLPSVDKSNHKIYQEYSVRLIGRVIFCWFLKQKKSVEGVSLLPEEFLSSHAVDSSDYYHKILEPIFFEILNKPCETRKPQFRNGYDKIPYLNGGLFDPHSDDFYEGQPNYGLKIPNKWFEDLFEILETYNFTIDENTTLDVDLSIDPEMLGRIFENLLAEINPETGESARKSTGSYYTPRPIVEYMVDQSLIQYLLTKTEISEEKIKALVSIDELDDEKHPLTEQEKKKIVDALDEVKIIDPACGSGAFPIGILQKIIWILQHVDQTAELWLEKKAKGLDPLLRRELSEKNFDFIRKIGVIRDSIYGVDIQSIAVEVSKLRCFLTLIVDEDIDDSADNRGIKPLPNLEFKFVAANSLISLPSSNGQQEMFESNEEIVELKKIRDSYFVSNGGDKEKIKTEFYRTQKKMFQKQEEKHFKGNLTKALANWDPFVDESSTWFDSEWMFGFKKFDIIVANPPYLDSESMVKNGQGNIRKLIQETYSFTKGNWDIYIAFFEFSFLFLSNNGVLIFITPDKWISKPFGFKLRESTIGNIQSIAKAGRGVFEGSKVDSIITSITKKITDNILILNFNQNNFVLIRTIPKKIIKTPFSFDWLFSNYIKLIIKIDSLPNRANSIGMCDGACATSDAYKLAPIIENLENNFENNIHFKIINTGTIGRYYSKWGTHKMTYLGNKFLNPIVKQELFYNIFKNSYARKICQPKIILKGLNLLDACLDDQGWIIPGKSTLIITDANINNLKVLLALINCKLVYFYIKEKYISSSYNQGITFTKDMINNLPIPLLDEKVKLVVIDLVDQILTLKKQNKDADTKNLEDQIDQLVYKLYGLTEEEIKIVEGEK